MPTPMDSLLEEVSRDHFAYPPATPEEIEAFEQRVGWTLDPDLRAFYLHCNGAELLRRRPDCPCRVLPLAEIVRARVAIRRTDTDEWGPASHYALCDVEEGSYVLVDVGRQEQGHYPLMDGWHGAYPDPSDCGQVAASFSEFLEKVLRTRDAHYWLQTHGQEADAFQPEAEPESTEKRYYGGITETDLVRGMGFNPETGLPLAEGEPRPDLGPHFRPEED